MATKGGVDLGFAEKTHSWRLLSHFFPSKIGGKPAWLALNKLPKIDDLSCGVCGKPCVFLLQVYGPITDLDTCFHRTVFIFMCKEAACSKPNDNRSFKIFRTQLKRDNEFYDSEPPDYDAGPGDKYPKAEDFGSLCCACGSEGSKKCGQCKSVSYCSKEHQTLHWKAGHKTYCKQPGKGTTSVAIDLLFPEFELVIEPEEMEGKDSDSEEEKPEEERMKEYEKVVKDLKNKEGEGLLQDAGGSIDQDLENMAMQESQVDKQFSIFRKRIKPYPDQILRYDRGGEPLWVSSGHRALSSDIPPCKYCSGPRKFEFQILPQLLLELKLDSTGESVDWGTLAVFTCGSSCSEGPLYKEEFMWKQDYSDINTV